MNDPMSQLQQAVKQPESRPAAVSPGRRLKPVAVLVVHGMGQQVPFQTLDEVYRGLRLEEIRAKGDRDVALRPNPEQAVVGEDRVRRLEVELRNEEGQIRPVHLYEGYWAPLTEGRVTLRDVFGFLVSGGWNAVASWWRGQKRIVFREQHKARSRWARPTIVVALAFISALIALNGLLAAASVADAASQGWLTSALRSDLLWLVGLGVLLPGAFYGLCLLLARIGESRWRSRLFEAKGKDGAPPDQVSPPAWYRFWAALGFVGFFLLLATTIAAPIMFAVLAFGRDVVADPFVSPPFRQLPDEFVYASLTILVAITAYVRRVLVQTMGDVAAYVQTHKLDRFNDLRDEVKKKVRTVANAIYRQQGPNGLLYEKVAIVGHSLGSVVAYNTLNDLLNEDDALGEPLQVRKRTNLLMTFGSPLDKLAFVFATQSNKTSWAREMLVARVQPLVYDFKFREFNWVNVYSSRDIISGSLEAYDYDPMERHGKHQPKPAPGGYLRVHNQKDAHARLPLLAHNEYWKNPRVWWVLRSHLI